MISKTLKKTLTDFASKEKHITVLTGAGISAESDIPTFRGPEGYWTVGSREYHPQEMATLHMFKKNPEEVWKWYLYRMNVCRKASPNLGHTAIVNMEKTFGNHFKLITQNVDNLHLRAGNSIENTFQIHGNIFFIRCAAECTSSVFPLPENLPGKSKGEPLTEKERSLLTCRNCGKLARPHVLWFDEVYNETHYHYQSSLIAAAKTDLLLIIGTSGATNLPNQIAWTVFKNKGTIIDINIEENPFSKIALNSENGFFIKEKSGVVLPEIHDIFHQNFG